MVLAPLLLSALQLATNLSVRCARDLKRYVYDEPRVGVTFDIEATVLSKERGSELLAFSDASDAAYASTRDGRLVQMACRNGDIVRICGKIDIDRQLWCAYATFTNLTVLRAGQPIAPIRTSLAEMQSGRFDFRFVTVRGVVRDIWRDQIDTNFAIMVLDDHGATSPVSLAADQNPDNAGLIGATVEISGICGFCPNGARRSPGRTIGPLTSLRVLSPPNDPFDAPPLERTRLYTPTAIAALGRRRLSGCVLAVCRDNRFVFRSDDHLVHTARTFAPNLPAVGDCVTVSGFPETDLYTVNFTHAAWKRECRRPTAPTAAKPVSARDILYDRQGRPCIQALLHGETIRLVGTVQDCRADGLLLRADGETVSVDTTSCSNALRTVECGSALAVTGTCVLDVERWHPTDTFTRIRGFSLVPRSDSDIRILARAPWWTPRRLLSAIGVLLALLAAFLVWNLLLKRASERRGKELADERVAHVETELKVYERTRLAVELHDALSQNLTGISFEIDAAERLSRTDGQAAQRHLAVASRTLDSCRTELKNCLWDLRNNALEDPDMDTAIRRTLGPVLGEESVAIRFAVARSLFTDATMHAILCIIRELTVNAIRHGKAGRILVAGSIEDRTLKFSVKDNGRGFDPGLAPSAKDGHYGLLGIRERVEAHGGTFRIESAPGKGCKATVSLNIPGED